MRIRCDKGDLRTVPGWRCFKSVIRKFTRRFVEEAEHPDAGFRILPGDPAHQKPDAISEPADRGDSQSRRRSQEARFPGFQKLEMEPRGVGVSQVIPVR